MNFCITNSLEKIFRTDDWCEHYEVLTGSRYLQKQGHNWKEENNQTNNVLQLFGSKVLAIIGFYKQH